MDAESNTHVWSKTYDRELQDVFAVQSEIARSVAEAMQVSLAERKTDVIAATHDPQAYDHFLQGQFFWNRRGPDDVGRAELHYRRAVEIDPNLARGWAGGRVQTANGSWRPSGAGSPGEATSGA